MNGHSIDNKKKVCFSLKIEAKFLLKTIFYFLLALVFVGLSYGFGGLVSARNDAQELKKLTISMKESGFGIAELGEDTFNNDGLTRADMIIAVEDPNYLNHSGYDFSTAGAGATTITQSLAKRLAFKNFEPGYQKIRQTGYAIGLETVLSKNEIFILFLNTAQMGPSPTGWIESFHRASKLYFRKPTSDLNDDEFIELIAVMIAPSELRLDHPNPKREDRVKRIKLLLANQCTPNGHDDVWLEGCSS